MNGILFVVLLIWAVNILAFVVGFVLVLRARRKEKRNNELEEARRYQ